MAGHEARQWNLLKKISEGDEDAFKELYESTYRRVYLYLYRILQDRQTAEDILVETYTVVWKDAKRFRGASSPTSWIIGIARNLAMNELRRRQEHEEIDEKVVGTTDGVITRIEDHYRKKVLREAISKLSVKHREILHLVFYEELTYQEIADLLNMPVNTVKTRVFYAKETLKKVLTEMGVRRDEI